MSNESRPKLSSPSPTKQASPTQSDTRESNADRSNRPAKRRRTGSVGPLKEEKHLENPGAWSTTEQSATPSATPSEMQEDLSRGKRNLSIESLLTHHHQRQEDVGEEGKGTTDSDSKKPTTTSAEDSVIQSLDVSPVPSPSLTPTAEGGLDARADQDDDAVVSGSASQEDRQYRLSLVSVPIQCTTSTQGFCDPPLVAKVVVTRTSDAIPWTHEEDLTLLSASVALWEVQEEGQPRQATHRLCGSGALTAQPQKFKEQVDGEDELEAIYFCFPGLQVIHPGMYRMSVTLQRQASDVQEQSEKLVLQVMAETPTLVVPEHSPLAVGRVQISPRVAALLENLKNQGANLP